MFQRHVCRILLLGQQTACFCCIPSRISLYSAVFCDGLRTLDAGHKMSSCLSTHLHPLWSLLSNKTPSSNKFRQHTTMPFFNGASEGQFDGGSFNKHGSVIKTTVSSNVTNENSNNNHSRVIENSNNNASRAEYFVDGRTHL